MNRANREQVDALGRQLNLASRSRRLALLRSRHPKESPLSPKHRNHRGVANLRERSFDVRDDEINDGMRDLAQWFLVSSSSGNHFFMSVFEQVVGGHEMSDRQARGLVNFLRRRLRDGRWSA